MNTGYGYASNPTHHARPRQARPRGKNGEENSHSKRKPALQMEYRSAEVEKFECAICTLQRVVKPPECSRERVGDAVEVGVEGGGGPCLPLVHINLVIKWEESDAVDISSNEKS
jgi:hypothetical protein